MTIQHCWIACDSCLTHATQLQHGSWRSALSQLLGFLLKTLTLILQCHHDFLLRRGNFLFNFLGGFVSGHILPGWASWGVPVQRSTRCCRDGSFHKKIWNNICNCNHNTHNTCLHPCLVPIGARAFQNALVLVLLQYLGNLCHRKAYMIHVGSPASLIICIYYIICTFYMRCHYIYTVIPVISKCWLSDLVGTTV